MRPTLTIAWREFRSLFFSPIGWILLALFIGVTSMQLFSQMEDAGAIQWLTGRAPAATQWLLIHPAGGVLSVVRDQLFYFVPLLTMGVFARERSNGSYMLTAASPLRPLEIVFGKYLALALFFVLFMVHLLVLSAVAALYVPHFDWAYVVSGLLGLYLLSLAYTSVGVFISALTRHQIVAAIGTLAGLFALDLVGRLGQDVPFIADVAFWVSLSGRVDWFLLGLITTEDVIYFLLIVTGFLALTRMQILTEKGTHTRGNRVLVGSAIVGMVLSIGLISSLPGFKAHNDLTREKARTLTPESQTIVDQLDGPIEITAYVNVLDRRASNYLPQYRRANERLVFSQYFRAKPNITLDYVFYYAPTQNSPYFTRFRKKRTAKELAQEWAYQRGVPFRRLLSPEDAETIPGLKENGYRPVFVARWNDQSQVISTYEDLAHFPQEDTISEALKRFIEPAHELVFTSGSGERSAFLLGGQHYSSLFANRRSRGALIHHGFNPSERNLNGADLSKVDVLVIADPTIAFDQSSLAQLDIYLEMGGDLLLFADYGSALPVSPILRKIGLDIAGSATTRVGSQTNTIAVSPRFTPEAAGLFEQDATTIRNVPFLMSNGAELKVSPRKADLDFDVTPVLELESNHRRFTALFLEREVADQTQKIAVFGDGDFIAQDLLTADGYDQRNAGLFLETMRWMTDGVSPGDYTRPDPVDRDVQATSQDIRLLRNTLQWGLPFLTLMLGGFVLITRRRA